MTWGFSPGPWSHEASSIDISLRSWLQAQNLDEVGGARISSFNEKISLMQMEKVTPSYFGNFGYCTLGKKHKRESTQWLLLGGGHNNARGPSLGF